MTKENKTQSIDFLVEALKNNSCFYVTDISGLDSEKTSQLRRLCFRKNVKLIVVKNTLFVKAMERMGVDYGDLYSSLKGSTSIMFSEVGNEPAKLIKEYKEKNKAQKPIIKGAYVEECTYVGDNLLETLMAVKSKNEVIGDIITLLQSPAKNVVSALQSSGGKLAGIVKTLSER